jgi:hypothetical protein
MGVESLRLFGWLISFSLVSNFTAQAATFNFLYSGQATGSFVSDQLFTESSMGSFSYSGTSTSVSLSDLTSFQFAQTPSFTFLGSPLASTFTYSKSDLTSFSFKLAGGASTLSLNTNGILGSDPGFLPEAFRASPPRTGQTLIQGLALTQGKVTLFPQIINKDSLTVIPDFSGPGSIGAQISIPSTFGLSLQQVTQLGGYDHFNWLQTITGFSFNGKPMTSIAPFGISALGRSVGFDPLLGGNFGSIDDNYPPYWNEVNCPLCESKYYVFTGENQTVFRDAPNLIQAGWSADFETELIGVRPDHSYDILSDTLQDPGLTFRWEYTQTNSFCTVLQVQLSECGQVVVSNIDPSLAGDGVVQFLGYGEVPSAVPEPETWLMMLTGFASLGFVAYHGRNKASRIA